MTALFRKIDSKIYSRQALREKLPDHLQGNQKIVFTNGCFDILHYGHVKYLEEAKLLGDFLVVALNSDESVKRLKGSDRPIHSLQNRLEVLAALESVDYVTWFDEDTPLETIQLIQPNVLVKGGDWEPHQIVGGKEVLSWGGKVISLLYLQGHSTTNIINKVQLSS